MTIELEMLVSTRIANAISMASSRMLATRGAVAQYARGDGPDYLDLHPTILKDYDA
jgi:hypothetical protein